MKIKWMVICFLLCLLTGCGSKEEEKVIYEGNLERIESEIKAYESNVALEPIAETKTCRVNQYILDLKLDVEKKQLSGTVQIDMQNETEDSLDRICVRNYAASILGEKGQSIISKVTSVAISENVITEKVLEYESKKEDASVIYVKLDKTLEPQEKLTLCVEFSTDIPKKNYRFGYHKEKENMSFVLTYCFPVIAMYENGQWCEYPYISHAESNYHTITDYEVTLEAPEEYLIAATGAEETSGGTTKIHAENIRDLAIVASNYMKVETINTQGIDINLYSLEYENTDGYNDISLLAGKDSIDLLTNLIGEYAYEELDIVQCFYSSAMEYPGLVLIGFPDLKSPEEIDGGASYSSVCAQIAHEVAHQWFYGAIGNNPYIEPWLDESFAEYFEDIVYPYTGCESVQKAAELDTKRLYGENLWGYETEKNLDERMIVQIEQSLDEYGKCVVNNSYEVYNAEEDSYSEHVYDGGAMFLYELQREMGDGAFFRMLQEYYKAGYLKEVTTQDFINAVKAFDDSDNVEKLLNKYLQ